MVEYRLKTWRNTSGEQRNKGDSREILKIHVRNYMKDY
jgi:hypothetical protein